MTQRELIDEVTTQSGLSRKEVKRIVEGVFKQMTLALERGDTVQILGFGTFKVKEHEARTVLNPRTGEPMEIPACKWATFTTGQSLKRAIRATQ